MKYSPTFHAAKRQQLRTARERLERLEDWQAHERQRGQDEVDALEQMLERLEAQRVEAEAASEEASTP